MILFLELLTYNEFNIKNSFSFAIEITTYDSLFDMSSLDFSLSLFITNILLNKTIINWVSDLHNKHLYNGKLPNETFLNFHKQHLANHLFLITFFISWRSGNGFSSGLHTCICISKPLWKIMVGHLQSLVDYMNKQHKWIKFTSDAEHNNSFSFLNIKITRNNQ